MTPYRDPSFRSGSLPFALLVSYILDVGRSEGWPRLSTPLMFAMGTWVNAL